MHIMFMDLSNESSSIVYHKIYQHAAKHVVREMTNTIANVSKYNLHEKKDDSSSCIYNYDQS